MSLKRPAAGGESCKQDSFIIRHNYKNDCHIFGNFCAYTVKTASSGGLSVKDYIEERAVEIANYIIDTKATVRQAAKKFGISKSTVHIEVTK